MTNFAINHDLAKLSDSERKQYLHDLSVFVGLDPTLNALDTIWLPDGYGRRNLVVYAKRGTAEILRELYKVSVISCQDISTAQDARFMVVGRNAHGRQEIAVGSHSTIGLAGDKFSSAVKSASTQANRRVTLQFVGAGILDESETQEILDANPASEARPLGAPIVFPAPTVRVNTAPGKDITPTSEPPLIDPKAAEALFSPNPPFEVPQRPTAASTPTSLEEFSAQQAALRAEAKDHLNAPDVPKRTRKPRNQKTLESPTQTEMPMGNIDSNGVITPQVSTPAATAPVPAPAALVVEAAAPLVQEPKAAAPIQATTSSTLVVEAANMPPPVSIMQAPATVAPTLDKEKFDEYRAKLAGIAKTLASAGMMPSAGIGGVNAKLKRFAILQTGINDVMTFTLEMWAELFEFFDQYANDAAGLVAYINKAVGA